MMIKEHQAASRRGEIEKSMVAEHAWLKQYQLKWKEVRVIDYADNKLILRIKEALHISSRKQEKLLNMDQSLEIDGCWTNIIRRRPHCMRTDDIIHMLSCHYLLCIIDRSSCATDIHMYSEEGHSKWLKCQIKNSFFP